MTRQQRIERILWLAAGSAVIALAGCAGMASNQSVRVTLTGANEVPAVATKASGTGTFVVGADRSVSGSVTTNGINGTAAHIHTGAAGMNGPIAVGMNRNGDNGWVIPAGAKFTEAQYEAYRTGGTYVNVHSAANKGGEIRGQLRP
jgi:hypothetical protein